MSKTHSPNLNFSVEVHVKNRLVFISFIKRIHNCTFEQAEDIFFSYIQEIIKSGVISCCPTYIRNGLRNRIKDDKRRRSRRPITLLLEEQEFVEEAPNQMIKFLVIDDLGFEDFSFLTDFFRGLDEVLKPLALNLIFGTEDDFCRATKSRYIQRLKNAYNHYKWKEMNENV